MNQSELIEKVAQATELNQAAVGQAVKAVVNAILDALVAGDAVRVSGLGIFNVAARPAREGRNPRTGEAIQIAASKLCDSTQARPSKMPSIHRHRRGLPGRRLHHQGNPRCESKLSRDALWRAKHQGFATGGLQFAQGCGRFLQGSLASRTGLYRSSPATSNV